MISPASAAVNVMDSFYNISAGSNRGARRDAYLVRAVIAKNFPVLGSIISSYEDQIESAFARRDLVSLIHRTAAWLASYFDIVFAGNRQYHPGEKRLLIQAAQLPNSPVQMVDDLTATCLREC